MEVIILKYEKMTKKELIQHIKSIENQRAYTYEDQMKLAILDESPFTIWASDRECKITLWCGKCEALYGYTKKQAIGQDYISLFVAEDERVAARADQLSIIDKGAIFHNIANDVGRNGNVLRLITNCFRIKDPKSGEYWNAEMGIVVDFYEQEKERLQQIVTESRMIKSFITWLEENTRQSKSLFLERKKTLQTAIQQCERKAILLGKREVFREERKKISKHLSDIEKNVNLIIDEAFTETQSCTSYQDCEDIKHSFINKFSETLNDFADIVLDVEEISFCYDNDNTIIADKDSIMKDSATRNRLISDIAHYLLIDIDNDISQYKSLNVDSQSVRLNKLIEQRDIILKYKEKLMSLTDSIHRDAASATSCEQLLNMRTKMEYEYKLIEDELLKIKERREI